MRKSSIKYLFIGSLLFTMLFSSFNEVSATHNISPKHEMRASWISTVANIDLKAGMNKSEYTAWVESTVKELERKNFNTIVFQVKPTSDALYPSKLAPWSRYITGGEQGTDPGYDPLQIMLDSAHEHGMELHAWINPYRVTMVSHGLEDLASDNIAIKNPDWALKHGSQYYLNPGIPEVQSYLIETVKELVENYDVDAVHMDDYFYPGADFEDEETFEEYGSDFDDIGDWRRNNVSELVKNININIKDIKPWVQFGISPSGIWRNISDDPNGSETNGQAHYDALFADSREWIREGSLDYITPQIYWSRELAVASYSVLLDWWSNQVETQANKHPVNLYIGMADYKVNDNFDTAWDNPYELPEQILDNRANGKTKGQMHFTLRDILANPIGYGDIIEEEIYNQKALTPEIPWNDPTIPEKPDNLKLQKKGDDIEVFIDNNSQTNVRKYVIYRFEDNVEIDYSNLENMIGIVYNKGDITTFIDRGVDSDQLYTYGVTSISRTGIESTDAIEVKWPLEIVDKSALELVVAEAEEKDELDYTEVSWQALNELLVKVKEILANDEATQQEVDEALELLVETINQLEKRPEEIEVINKAALKLLIAEAEKGKKSDYTEESWQVFNKMLTEANLVFEDDQVTQDEINTILTDLKTAMSQLVQVSKESTPIKKNKSDKKVRNDEVLPNTATNTFNLLLAGSLILLIGGIMYFINRKRLGNI